MDDDGWIRPQSFVRVVDDRRGEPAPGKFYHVEAADDARFVFTWGDGGATAPVTSGSLVEAEAVKSLEPIDEDLIHQVRFGVDAVGALIYVRLPPSISRGGVDQVPKQNSANRYVGETDAAVSPFDRPSRRTEFFVRTKSDSGYPNLDCYNSTPYSITPRIRFFVRRLKLGEVTPEAQQRLRNLVIPFTPIRMVGIAPGGGSPNSGGG